MPIFRTLLGYVLISTTTTGFVWFALTYFAYLETQSVISTSLVGGLYLVATTLSGFWFGSLVDRYRKKQVMMASSVATLICFTLALGVYRLAPPDSFTSVTDPVFWLFSFVLMAGIVAGNIINIAVAALITHLVSPAQRDKANGTYGMITGISFAITSVASGLVLGYAGMTWVLASALPLTVMAIIYLFLIPLPEKKLSHTRKNNTGSVDIRGTLRVIRTIPGLLALILFATFNNFLGGVFMALMDAYGLTLVSVQTWGILWGILSLGFIIGGIIITKKGLGKNPLRTLLTVNAVNWTVCIFFVIQPSIILLFIGSLIWMSLIPFAEAAEQTVIQKVVPKERQGRVFGFSQSVEQAASPLTAFLIGPIAQFIFIPFMTDGRGAELIGRWFGTGPGRGIALVFIAAGITGLAATALALRSGAYTQLSRKYLQK